MNAGQFAASPEYEKSLEDKTPLARIGETEDIAAKVSLPRVTGCKVRQRSVVAG